MDHSHVDNLVALLDAKMGAGVGHVNLHVDQQVAACSDIPQITSQQICAASSSSDGADASDDAGDSGVFTEVDYSLVPLACAMPTSMYSDQE